MLSSEMGHNSSQCGVAGHARIPGIWYVWRSLDARLAALFNPMQDHKAREEERQGWNLGM